MCRVFEHKLRRAVFNLFTPLQRLVADRWSLTADTETALGRNVPDQESG